MPKIDDDPVDDDEVFLVLLLLLDPIIIFIAVVIKGDNGPFKTSSEEVFLFFNERRGETTFA